MANSKFSRHGRDILNCLPPLLADWKDNKGSSSREAFEQMKKSVLHQKDERKHSITAPDFRVFVEAILQMCSKVVLGQHQLLESVHSSQID